MKIALCFLINYDHIIEKEEIWREWINMNSDIINVYIHYGEHSKIQSSWIKKYCLPKSHIYQTSYMNIIPAQISLLNYALQHDKQNEWFCFLTDTCCPIISPRRFRYLFFTYHHKTFLHWKKAWWRTDFHKRANLALLPEKYHLANDPWFILSKYHTKLCLHFVRENPHMLKTIVSGGLANESLYAIILYHYQQLENKNTIFSVITHLTDWSRMTSATSPYVFSHNTRENIEFIEKGRKEHPYAMFLRKVKREFPDETLHYFIYQYSQKEDKQLKWREPISWWNLALFSISGLFLFLFLFNQLYTNSQP